MWNANLMNDFEPTVQIPSTDEMLQIAHLRIYAPLFSGTELGRISTHSSANMEHLLGTLCVLPLYYLSALCRLYGIIVVSATLAQVGRVALRHGELNVHRHHNRYAARARLIYSTTQKKRGRNNPTTRYKSTPASCHGHVGPACRPPRPRGGVGHIGRRGRSSARTTSTTEPKRRQHSYSLSRSPARASVRISDGVRERAYTGLRGRGLSRAGRIILIASIMGRDVVAGWNIHVRCVGVLLRGRVLLGARPKQHTSQQPRKYRNVATCAHAQLETWCAQLRAWYDTLCTSMNEPIGTCIWTIAIGTCIWTIFFCLHVRVSFSFSWL